MIPRLAKRLGLDTISKLESAATWRLSDAIVLQEKGRLVGAVYLFGYVAEARLQAACLRLLGLRPHTLVTEDMRRRIVAEAIQLRFMGRSPHNIAGWAKYLIYWRRRRTTGFSRDLRDEINQRAESVYGYWRPALRYRTVVPAPLELQAVRTGAEWFEHNYNLLWR